jgi:hypothetical protein
MHGISFKLTRFATELYNVDKFLIRRRMHLRIQLFGKYCTSYYLFRYYCLRPVEPMYYHAVQIRVSHRMIDDFACDVMNSERSS